jgi:hypothetical protein
MTRLTTETIRETEYTVTVNGTISPMDRQGHPLIHRTYQEACDFAAELEQWDDSIPPKRYGIAQRVVIHEPWFTTTREA